MSRARSTSDATPRPLRRRGAAVVATSMVLLIAVSGLASADPTIPYTDPDAVGLITLCNQSGDPLETGSVTSAPFVWSVHTDVAAPQGYGLDGRTAVLAGYQPRQGVDPGEWSGKFVSTVARYDDPAHPTVQSAATDVALRDLVVSYPPQWDHLLQLRVYLGAPGLSTYTDRYAALDLRISDDGRTWTALERGTASCHVGSAVSAATLLHLTPPTGTALVPAVRSAEPGTAGVTAVPSTVATAPAVASTAQASAAAPVPAVGSSAAPAGVRATSSVPTRLAAGVAPVAGSARSRGGAIAAAFLLFAVVAGGWGGAFVRGRGSRTRIQPVAQNLSRELESR